MKKCSLLFSFILILMAFTSCKKPPFTDPYPFDPNHFGQTSYTPAINAAIITEMTAGKIPGVAVGVIKRNKIEFLKGYGVLAAGAPDTDSVGKATNFYAGDLGNMLVLTALYQLHDQGLLDMDEDIDQYLPFAIDNPSFPTDPITPRMLISGTSCILDNPAQLTALSTIGDSPIQLKDFLKEYLTPAGIYFQAANFFPDKPGKHMEASKVAVALSAYLVERITGTNINEYAKAHINTDMGFFDCGFFLNELNPQGLATGHDNSAGLTSEIQAYGYPYYPGGQYRNNVTNLSRLLLAYSDSGKYATKQMFELTYDRLGSVSSMDLFDPAFPLTDPDQATGWRYAVTPGGRSVIGISTSGFGFSNRMWWDPAKKIGVVVLSNADNCDVQVSNIADILFDNADN